MTQIGRNLPVPIPSAQRVAPADAASGSNSGSHDHQPRRDAARLPVPNRPAERREEARPGPRARSASAAVVVQLIAGQPRRGLKAEQAELDRYRRAYARAAAPRTAPRPEWEKSA